MINTSGWTYCKVAMTVMGAAAFFLAGCAGKDQPTEELVVLCGSSFVKPTEHLCREFTQATGIVVATTAAGSEDFLPLIKAASKGDVLVTHDPFLQYVKDAGEYADHVQVGFVAPVLAVQKGNPRGLKKIEDLTQKDLKVGLSDPQFSTCGEMVFALLEEKGIKGAVLANVDNRLTKGHPVLGTWLKTGAVDAVIMWNGVAHTFANDLEVVKTPYEYKEEVCVHVIGLDYTEQPEALKRFIEFIRLRGPEVFTEYGYIK
ncbi:MAG: substrate-binding domain-containing protein [Phycisphaerae bacterium]|nr:substrate-binding domain-containing protein [Phycisphaerae bacterium]